VSDLFSPPIKVSSALGNYEVKFETLSKLPFVERSVVIFDRSLPGRVSFDFPASGSCFEIDVQENNKSMETCIAILEFLAKTGLNKGDSLLAIGGGVVQDLTTLCASIYMRGIDWYYVPTTLMSMMDSCLGGKSSINLSGFKNILGNFYPPLSVYIDTRYVSSLNAVDISSGISEGMKICFAKGREEFYSFLSKIEAWRETNSLDFLNQAIRISLNAKKFFIETDEFDSKERRLLNFGHSFGHALEASTHHAIPHGIAILVGMRAAIIESTNDIHCRDLTEAIYREIRQSKFTDCHFRIDKTTFLSAMRRDKKNRQDTQVLILPNGDGRLELISRPMNDESLTSCWNSIELALSEGGFSYEVL